MVDGFFLRYQIQRSSYPCRNTATGWLFQKCLMSKSFYGTAQYPKWRTPNVHVVPTWYFNLCLTMQLENLAAGIRYSSHTEHSSSIKGGELINKQTRKVKLLCYQTSHLRRKKLDFMSRNFLNYIGNCSTNCSYFYSWIDKRKNFINNGFDGLD